jgi:transposase
LARSANATLPLHVVLDNYATHKHPEVRQWLAEPANQRITLHSTPTGCSWLNMVETFGTITRQAIRRGTFTSVKDLTTAVDAYNDRCQPFNWTMTRLGSRSWTFDRLNTLTCGFTSQVDEICALK